jgi:ectoine hydroxylase-related dioxygenase (phytanoyl-CoA dioxygenase family)
MMNAQQLLDSEGFVVFDNVFDEDIPGLQCLKKFASGISIQQVCLDFDELQEHSSSPESVLMSAASFRRYVIEFIEKSLECCVENADANIWKDLDYVRRKTCIGSYTPSHRDCDFLRNDRSGVVSSEDDLRHFYTVWIPFVDVTKAHSHLQFQPGSHLTVSSINQPTREKLRWKHLIVSKYSLVIFSSRLLHKASIHNHRYESRTSIDFRFRIRFNKT